MCRLKGVRLNIFRDLLDVLRITGSGESKLLDVVRPLCVFVADLPAIFPNYETTAGIGFTRPQRHS